MVVLLRHGRGEGGSLWSTLESGRGRAREAGRVWAVALAVLGMEEQEGQELSRAGLGV